MPAAVRRGVRPARKTQTTRQAKENPANLEVVEADIEITDLNDDNEAIKMLLFGPSGHGKTVLAGGAPNAIFISTEKGSASARRAGSKARRISTPRFEQVVAAKKWCDANLGISDWVILDSLTKMQVLMIRWILRTIHEINDARDLDIPAIQDHQKWQNYFKRFVDEWIDAPYNVIFICGEMTRTDKEGDPITLPAITGKDYEICDYVRSQTDVNLYYAITTKAQSEDGTPVRRVLAQPVGPFVACKDRYTALGVFQDVYDGEFFAMAEFIDMIHSSTNSVPDVQEETKAETTAKPRGRSKIAV
jgi:AAA domain